MFRAMEDLGLKQTVVTDETALFYLLGQRVEPMERCAALLLTEGGGAHAFMNRLFRFHPPQGVVLHEYQDGEDVYAMLAAHLSLGELGIDGSWPSRHTIALLERRRDLVPVLGSAPVDLARTRKDEEEQALLLQAGETADRALAFGFSRLSPEESEADLARALDGFFLAQGGRQAGQYQVVCFGPSAADPHHVPGEARPRPGDAVLLDLVYPINGYWCDVTRTVFYRRVSSRHREIYQLVRRAQQTGAALVRPGVKLRDVDAAVRGVIAAGGYGDAFLTRTGHGVGLSVHEAPEVSASSETTAEPGMVFSIEPGIYLSGDVGIRIEDLVLVTEDGCRRLTHFPRELQIAG